MSKKSFMEGWEEAGQYLEPLEPCLDAMGMSETEALQSVVGKPRILVAGLGNLLMRDDGIGVHAIQLLRRLQWPANVLVVEIGTAVIDALHLLEWADRILVIDALQAGGRPGTIYRCEIRDLREATATTSLHELGLHAVLRFLCPGATPLIEVLGVEPAEIDFGIDPSPLVQASLPELVPIAIDIVSTWQGGTV